MFVDFFLASNYLEGFNEISSKTSLFLARLLRMTMRIWAVLNSAKDKAFNERYLPPFAVGCMERLSHRLFHDLLSAPVFRQCL